MIRDRRDLVLGWLLATVGVVVAIVITAGWPPLFWSRHLLLTMAVVVAGWYGGLWLGVLASVVAAVAGEFALFRPLGAVLNFDTISRFLTFLITGILSAHLCSNTRTIRHERVRFRDTLSSIGDGVITTDAHGAVASMNPVAERLTGWSFKDAFQRPLTTVFAIVNEDTRAVVENPVEQVLREGVVAGLANHTLLIRKDGSEGPIDDSGAPIRSAHGAITGAVLVFRDITERRRAERALMESEARFRRIADAAPVMVWMATADTTRSFFNQPWLRFTGRKLEQEVGGQWVENVHPDDRSSALDTYLSAFHARRTFRTEYRLRRSDGTYRWILDTGVPLHDADGSFAGYIGSGIDITEIKDLEADRARILAVERDARSQAEAASRLKDEFLHTVSHELRQPLNSIIGWLHLLDQGRLDPHAAARAIATSRRSAEALKRLVEDLLDFDQLVAGRMRINLQPMDLAPVLSAALETVRPTADVKGVRLVAEVLPHVTVAGDADRLQQVFWNLLDNAVKFTSASGAVEIHLAEMEATAVVFIRDTGEGIAPAFLPHVFERFAQQDSSTSRRHSGLGLGLAIVRELVERHAGTVEAQSAGVGLGATFIVTLPVIRP
jgi:PAS domain S-box-containing protein